MECTSVPSSNFCSRSIAGAETRLFYLLQLCHRSSWHAICTILWATGVYTTPCPHHHNVVWCATCMARQMTQILRNTSSVLVYFACGTKTSCTIKLADSQRTPNLNRSKEAKVAAKQPPSLSRNTELFISTRGYSDVDGVPKH